MSIKIEFLFMLCLSKTVLSKKVEDQPIMIKLDTDQLVDTFKAVLSSPYIRKIAEEMATKTAEHILEEMKNQNNDYPYTGKFPKIRKTKKSKEHKVQDIYQSDDTELNVSNEREPYPIPIESETYLPFKKSAHKLTETNKHNENTREVDSVSEKDGKLFNKKRYFPNDHENYASKEIENNKKFNYLSKESYYPVQDNEKFLSIAIKDEANTKEDLSREREDYWHNKAFIPSDSEKELRDRKNTVRSEVQKSILPENVAFELLKAPAPDGDNLDLDSLETVPKKNTKKTTTSVRLKINGAYFRRLLELLEQ